jgi:hypothetical protein
MFVGVNAHCAHQVRPPLTGVGGWRLDGGRPCAPFGKASSKSGQAQSGGFVITDVLG